MFREYDLDIGVNTVSLWIPNQIYYYHIGFVLTGFNAYGNANVVFISVTDTEQKQIQTCCNSTE